jgi:phosphatidate cytidylyltransferase
MSELAIPLRWTLGSIYGVLVTASTITAFLRRLRPAFEIDEIATRIRTWWAMTIAFTVAVVAGSLVTTALFALLGLVGTRECLQLLGVRDRIAAGLAFSAVPLTYGLLALGHTAAAWLAPLVLGVFVAPAVLALAGRVDRFVLGSSAVTMAAMFTVWAPLHAVLLLVAPGIDAPAGRAALLVFLVVCTEANDVAQFLWGKALGRTPVSPTVSPNKTRAGLIGGVATTTVLAGASGWILTPLSFPAAALTGAALGLLGFAGDITVSALKRSAGAKDSGSALPGHGGVLDRIDSLIFTAPAFLAIAMLT